MPSTKIKNQVKKFIRFLKLFHKNRILDLPSPYPIFYSFVMEQDEKKLFEEIVKGSKYYLEFGSGGSTFKTLQISRAVVHSVESDLFWMDQIRLHLFIKYHTMRKRLKFHHVDIGALAGWGRPANQDSKHLFPNYSSTIFDSITAEKIDTVLVDGRFRVACTLSTILHCHGNKGLRILIHDF